jgi:L-arabinose isomerase
MADGYGFGGEGDWKTSALVRILKVMAGDRPGGTSFMEDYTYHLGPGEPKILGAHMLEVCPTITEDRPSLEIHPLGIGGREDPVRLVFRGKPGNGFVVGLCDLGSGSASSPTTSRSSRPTSRCPSCPWRARSGSRRRRWRPPPRPGSWPAGRTTPA